MHRARCRGTSLFHVQLLLASAALNLKRLTARDLAAEGTATGPACDQTTAPDARSATPRDASPPPPITPSSWTFTLSNELTRPKEGSWTRP
jgi:hypothetical protein